MDWVNVLLWIGRIVAVVALLCFAAVLATPPGRLPLALRGLQKMLRKDRAGEASSHVGEASSPPQQQNAHPTTSPTTSPVASPARRFAALLLVLLAALLAMV